MKYSIPYSAKDFKHFDEIAEIAISFNPADSTLPRFLEAHVSQTIVIDVNSLEHYDLFLSLYNKYHNIKLRLSDINMQVIGCEVPFFFKYYAEDWDTFHGLLARGVSNIYITNALGFNVIAAAKYAKAKNVNIRAIANIAQTSWSSTPGLKTFFIRPEDVESYANYIDVIEFICEKDRFNTYYEIYKSGVWFGKLNEIIRGFVGDIDNRNITNMFAAARKECNKKCLYGGGCKTCERIESLAKTMYKNGIIITQK